MKKKVIYLLLISMLVFAIFGCSQKINEKDGVVNITIWHDKEEAVVKVLEEAFLALEPGIKVVLEKKSNLTEALKIIGNDPKSAPDMYFFAHDKIGVYAEMGILAPITSIVEEGELDDFIDSILQAATYKGEIYQFPIYYETLLFMYNRRYMKEDNIPKTTEELYTYMVEKTKGGHYGFIEQHSTPYYSAGWMNGFGGYIINEERTPGLNLPETIKALSYHKKFADLMPGESEYATVNTLFKEGKAHSTIGGPWLIPTIREAGIDLGIAPMPVINETNIPISPYLGVQGIQVLKYAAKEKKEEVEKVLKLLKNPEIGISLAKASGCAPANEKAYENQVIINDVVVMAMKEAAEYSVPMPNIPELDVMWTVTGNLLTDVNMSGKDVTESANKAQIDAMRLIENMQ